MISRPQNSRDKKPYTCRNDDPLNTGHPLVDAIYCVQIEGFVHDQNWLKHPKLQAEKSTEPGKGKTKDKKANMAYQLVWAYLVDKYRPIKWRDSETGQTYYVKKFDSEWWATTYAKLARELGIGTETARNAVEFFVKRGLAETRAAPHLRDPEKPKEKPFEIWPIPEMVRLVTGRGNLPVELSEPLDTGNWVCNEMAQIRLKGNVIDYNWLGHPRLRNKDGHTDGLLLVVLADLFFLHRPTPRVDPFTHQNLPRVKKFDGDKLYKGYKTWAEQSDLTDDQLRRAVAELSKEASAVISYEIGPVYDRAGEPTNNKVIIDLNLPVILEITYGTSLTLLGQNREAPPQNGLDAPNSSRLKSGGRSPKSGNRVPRTGDRAPQAADKHSSTHSPPHSSENIEQQQQEPADFERATGLEFDVDVLPSIEGGEAPEEFGNSPFDEVAETQTFSHSKNSATSNDPNSARAGAVIEGNFHSEPGTDQRNQKAAQRNLTQRARQAGQEPLPGVEGSALALAADAAPHKDVIVGLAELTTATAAAIAPHVVKNPKWARQVLEYWPHLDESKMREPAAVLIEALKKPGSIFEPTAIRRKRVANEKREQQAEDARIEREKEAARKEAENEAAQRQRALAIGIAPKFLALSISEQEALFKRLADSSQFGLTAAKVTKAGGIQHIEQHSPTWFDFFRGIYQAMNDTGAFEPVPMTGVGNILPQAADESDEDEEAPFEVPTPVSRDFNVYVTALVQRLQDDIIGPDEMDDVRVNIAGDWLEDAEWEIVKENALLLAQKAA